MEIRKTTLEDLPILVTLFANARSFMAANGNPNQWGTNKPSKARIEQDIMDGDSYICEENGRIIATFFYKFGDDPTYTKIYDGQWPDCNPYGVVHRITSDGTTKGAASYCLNWALQQCKTLRIDTHEDNTIMQNMLKKNGFKYCGIIHIEDGSERLAYQKKVGE